MESKLMINISSIKSFIDDKKMCILWLKPEKLSVEQIRNTKKEFASIVTFTIDGESYEDRLVSFTSSLIDDILAMNISEEEKDKSILDLVLKPSKIQIFSSLAKRSIRQIDMQLKKCEEEVNDKWLEGEYNPKAIALLDEYKEWSNQDTS